MVVDLAEVYSPQVTAAPGTGFLPGPLDEDPPHSLRRGGEEVSSALPVDMSVTHAPKIRLVDQRRGLKCVPGSLLAHPLLRDLSQLVIDENEQSIRRVAVGRADGLDQSRDFTLRLLVNH